MFRVRMNGLKPETTYYYTVDSMGADGNDDGVKGSVQTFYFALMAEGFNMYPRRTILFGIIAENAPHSG